MRLKSELFRISDMYFSQMSEIWTFVWILDTPDVSENQMHIIWIFRRPDFKHLLYV